MLNAVSDHARNRYRMSFLKDVPLEPWLSSGASRTPEARQPGTDELLEPRPDRAAPALDADMLELVQIFETRYAELTPEPDARDEAFVPDDFAFELPDDQPATRRMQAAVATRPVQPPMSHETETGGEEADSASRTDAGEPALDAPQPVRSEPPEFRDWSTASRTGRPRLIAAIGIALAIGTGVGFIAGKAPASSAASAKIQPSPEGGARLRFDYALEQR